MSDIFISYSSEDKGRVQALARALERKGWSVWWDRRIPAGKSFDDVIHEALKAARSVVVVWTKTSVKSTWVKNESRSGLRRNILFPVMLLDEVEIPLEFEHLQAAHLMDWKPDQQHSGFDQFIDDLAEVIGVPVTQSQATPTSSAKPTPEPETESLQGAVQAVLISGNNNLSALTLSPGTLVPSFAASTTDYTVNVASDVTSVNVSATKADSNAVLSGNVTVGSGTATGQATIPLNGPATTTLAVITVTAPNGSSKTYRITVNRATPSGNNNLSALTVSSGTLTPAFNANTLSYTVDVASTVTSATVTPTRQDPNATITLNGQPTNSGRARTVPLSGAGSNTLINIVVTAPNGSQKTYIITVERAPLGGNNNLLGLTVSPGLLTPAFTATTTSYTVDVASTVANITVTPKRQDPNATITVNGQATTSGQPRTIALNGAGSNTLINIEVTAPNGAQKTYAVNVYRAALAGNNSLSALTVTPLGLISPAFTASTTQYMANVSSAVINVTVAATKADPNAVISGDVSAGAGIATGQATIQLNGPGTATGVTIWVTAPGGAQKTYTVNVFRAALGGNYNLQSLSVSPGRLAPSFSASRTSYTVNVGGNVTSVTVTPILQDINSSMTINGQGTSAGQARSITLAPAGSSTEIEIIVVASNGSNKTYLITVNRATLSRAAEVESEPERLEAKPSGVMGGAVRPDSPRSMSRIFISYRREDSTDVTGRIYDRLRQEFGAGAVFIDVDSIPFGVDFRKYLDTQVSKCEVFLVVIGRDWIKKRGSKGKSRLEDPGDFVRIEVESALKRDIPIIPVLVSGAAIPPLDRLPAGLQELSYRNALVVRPDPDFHPDMDRLVEFLKEEIGNPVDQPAAPSVTVKSEVEDVKARSSPVAKERPLLVSEEKQVSVLEEKPASVSEEKPTRTIEEKPSPKSVETVKLTDRQSRVRNQNTAGPEPPFEMVRVPKGPFLYGDQKTRETIDYDYWIDKYPVTNEKYRVFISAGGYGNQQYWSDDGWKWKTTNNVTGPQYWDDPQWNKADHPVVGVSYFEAEAYAKWAGKRLPTEQEWEKAARGQGDGREYPWGDEFDKGKCNSAHARVSHTTPVTSYSTGVSPYGCYDMVGNVWEWCADWYDERKGLRVIRGGSWDDRRERKELNVWCRRSDKPGMADDRDNTIGFRLAQNVK